MKAVTATFNESKKPSASQISRLQPAHTSLLQRKCACGGTPGPSGECEECARKKRFGLQTKLKVSEPGDVYEQEADRVADAVIRMPDSKVVTERGLSHSNSPQRVQRLCPECKEEFLLRTKAVASHTPDLAPGVASDIQTLRGGGSPLPESARQFFEPRFGHDFSDVRIHTDQRAAESARAINALAYTVGRDIVFGARQFAPDTARGKTLLAHELTHVVQQRSQAPEVIQSPPEEANENPEVQIRTELPRPTKPRQSVPPTIQRDLALKPPHPAAAGRVLTPTEMTNAIAFNNKVVGAGGTDLIREIRDVLGTSPTPAVVDEDFVNAVVTWQAMQGLTQDGQLGPVTAAPLFREIGAEKAGECKVVNGVTYVPGAPAPVAAAGGGETTHFAFNAEFENTPATGAFPSCCEIRQFIRWNAAAAAGMGPTGVPHGGFPAATPIDTFIEDRDAANHRYGHRSGPFSDPQSFDQYLDSTGARNQAFGHLYRGTDDPQVTPAMAVGQWQFYVKVVDVCRGEVRKGDDSLIRINW